jgi:hypothetical protein
LNYFLFILIFAVYTVIPNDLIVEAANETTYYVDCNGSDQNSGKSSTQAWQTLDKVNNTDLFPGDRLLFKRGCTWEGTLEASWHGSALRNILISAMVKECFQNTKCPGPKKAYNNVDITGSYLVIEYLEPNIIPC